MGTEKIEFKIGMRVRIPGTVDRPRKKGHTGSGILLECVQSLEPLVAYWKVKLDSGQQEIVSSEQMVPQDYWNMPECRYSVGDLVLWRPRNFGSPEQVYIIIRMEPDDPTWQCVLKDPRDRSLRSQWEWELHRMEMRDEITIIKRANHAKRTTEEN